MVRSWPGCLVFWLGLVNARASSNFAHQVRLMTALALAMINDDAAAEEEAAVAAAAAEARLSSATTAESMFVYLFAFSC